MSPLKAQLYEEMKTAMKAHDAQKLGVVRYLISEIKNWEIDHGEQNDAGVQGVIAREVKKMKDAVLDFKKGGRQDLVDEESAKIGIMESYLPKEIGDQELEKIVRETIEAAPDKNFGNIMKAVMAKVQNQAGGSRVSTMVRELLDL